MSKYDFSGYATKNDLRCSDGRTIRKNAFAHQDGQTVPLIWSHQRTSPMDVLGHAVLENREDGVYAYGSFNDTELGNYAKQLVQHGDIVSMSIYANNLKQRGGDVLGGSIKEVSLVMAGANPGALIDNVVIQHSDGSTNQLDDEAYIFCGEEFDKVGIPGREIKHEDSKGETIQDIWDTLSEKQKTVVYAIVGEAMGNGSVEAEHSDEEESDMKYNVFDDSAREKSTSPTLSHSDMNNLIQRARDSKADSLKAVFEETGMTLSHAPTEDRPNGIDGIDYGVANLDVLLPEYKNVRDMPDLIARDDAWVARVMGGVSKVPFSRIKTMTVDITADIARARGYRKGHLKKEEVIKMAKRVTGPTTIYKKQRLDRDDIIDISNFNIVAYLKSEMQRMLREELARAILVGDGRPEINEDGKPNEDKIEEHCIRPILKEDELYAFTVDVDFTDPDRDARYRKLIDDIAISMIDYNGSGNTVMFTTKRHHTMMRMIRDKVDHKLYSSDSELYSALGVGTIVDTQIMENIVDEEGRELIAIILDLRDYTIGMNNGGQTAFFDDFDIDFNQYKYLYETRLSGALTRPDSAVIIKTAVRPPLHVVLDGADDEDDMDLGSKMASDIQENVKVSTTGNISGVLKYVTGWTEFDSRPQYQNGYFLALKIENDGSDSDATVSARLRNDKVSPAFKPVNEDGVFVCRVVDEMNQRLEVRLSGTDGKFETYVYNLSGLRLEKKE